MYVTHLKEVVVGHSKAARMSFLMCPYFLFKIPLSEQFSPYFGSRLVGKYEIASLLVTVVEAKWSEVSKLAHSLYTGRMSLTLPENCIRP